MRPLGSPLKINAWRHDRRYSAENFEVVLRENPAIVMAILKELAWRLKATDERLRPPVGYGEPSPLTKRADDGR